MCWFWSGKTFGIEIGCYCSSLQLWDPTVFSLANLFQCRERERERKVIYDLWVLEKHNHENVQLFFDCIYIKKKKFRGWTGSLNSACSSWMISGAMQDSLCRSESPTSSQNVVYSDEDVWYVSRFLLCNNYRFCTILRWVSSISDCN